MNILMKNKEMKYMKEIYLKEKNMEKENYIIITNQYMKENFLVEKNMEKEKNIII